MDPVVFAWLGPDIGPLFDWRQAVLEALGAVRRFLRLLLDELPPITDGPAPWWDVMRQHPKPWALLLRRLISRTVQQQKADHRSEFDLNRAQRKRLQMSESPMNV